MQGKTAGAGLRAWACGLAGGAALGLLALLACAAPGGLPGLGEPGPALWRADAPDGRGTFWLLGSVHMGRDGDLALGPAVEAAWESAEELVVEVDADRIDPVQVIALQRMYGTLAPPLRLRDVLSAETWGQLDAYLALRGIAEQELAGFKPWFVNFLIVQIELQRAGYQTERGVDRVFIERARGSRSVVALESAASQLETMDRLPASLQELMLRDALARVDHFPQDTQALVEAWQRGDDGRLEELVFGPLAELPELEVFYDLVFFQRNENMAARLAQLGGDGRTRFVVLGAGHMVGEQGIPAILARRGFQVTRR